MAAAIETAVTQGRLNIKQIRELMEASVDIDSMVSENLRETLFKKTVDDIFSSVLENSMTRKYMIKSHQISTLIKRARGVVCELAQTRLSNSLIQAVALLRQRNHEGVVSSLNDMLACDKAVPHSRPLSWEVPEELADLYTIYLKSDPNPGKWCRLQYLLGINDPAAALRERGDSFLNITEQEEGFVF